MSEEEQIEEVESTVDEAPAEEVTSEGEETADVADEAPADVWSHFRQMEGFSGQDDTAIAQRLYQALQQEQSAQHALQQYQSIMPVAQEYLNNREAFEAWKAQSGAPQQQAQAQAPAPQQEEQSWWNPPKISESDKRFLSRDENGREVISESAPLDVAARLRDYQQYRADFAERLISNPQETLGPMVEKVAMERAQSIVDSRINEAKDQQYVQYLEEQNKDWLYDENGIASAEGLAVQKYIQDAKSLGIAGVQARWDFATKMVERDLLLAKMNRDQQAPPAAPPQQAAVPQPATQRPTQAEQNMDYLRSQAMRSSSQRAANSGTNARAPAAQMTFQERLLAQAQEQGLL
jgi:hypothetical protein